jgi:hypothetical protein
MLQKECTVWINTIMESVSINVKFINSVWVFHVLSDIDICQMYERGFIFNIWPTFFLSSDYDLSCDSSISKCLAMGWIAKFGSLIMWCLRTRGNIYPLMFSWWQVYYCDGRWDIFPMVFFVSIVHIQLVPWHKANTSPAALRGGH